MGEIEKYLIIAIVTNIVLLVILIIILSKPKDKDSLKLLQNQIFNLNKTLDSKLSENTKTIDEKLQYTNENINEKLDNANKLLSDNMTKTFATTTKVSKDASQKIEDITKKLTQLEETNKQIKDIGGQLRGLENILKNPKQRGNLGEYFLKELLDNVFTSEQYKIQYSIDGVGIVDAVLFLNDLAIPLDSKFPQENYEKLVSHDDKFNIDKYSKELVKDLKNRIDETSKYIIPEKGTSDFAFMLIPAEGMYYDIFINHVGNIDSRALIEYGFSKKVIICSPSGFYAYLLTVVQGMNSLKIEQQAKEIQKNVIKLKKDLENYEELFAKIGKNLGTTVNSYNDAYKRYAIVDKDIMKVTLDKKHKLVEPVIVNKPEND